MRELLAVERVEEQGAGFVAVPSPAPVGLQLPVRTVKTRSQGMIQLGHTPGQAPRLESLGVGVAPEPRVAVPSVAFQLPPELLGPTGGDFVGQRGDILERNNSTLPGDRDYQEVSVSSTGAVHRQLQPYWCR